ncbi:hypothetical protein KM043_007029 [Ampulex compressa]|nr:hypothetical protein KM043_007029 [Ampulex compressa]
MPAISRQQIDPKLCNRGEGRSNDLRAYDWTKWKCPLVQRVLSQDYTWARTFESIRDNHGLSKVFKSSSGDKRQHNWTASDMINICRGTEFVTPALLSLMKPTDACNLAS